MRQLRLVGLNEDGSRLILRDEAAKTDYLLPLDERLSAALRGDRARLGQLEINLESQLRPRDMQARVRAGESPESVAEAAGIPLDRILRFVAPVISEREYIAEQAQKSAVRRPGGEGLGPVLGPTVIAKLDSRGVAGDTIRWDAWRRDDAKWTVLVAYSYEGRDRTASWTYDPGARAAHADDDDASALSGVRPAALDRPLLDPEDAAEMAAAAAEFGFAADDESGRSTPRLAAVRGAAAMLGGDDDPNDDPTDDTDDFEDAEGGGESGDDEDNPKGRSRRAHVPSWDEIMFGRRRTRD